MTSPPGAGLEGDKRVSMVWEGASPSPLNSEGRQNWGPAAASALV